MVLFRTLRVISFSSVILALGTPSGGLVFAADKSADKSKTEVAGRAISVSGQVLIRQDSQTETAARPLKAGGEIRKNDIINTASDGSLKILFTDKTILDLGPSALFKVNTYELKNGNDRQVGMSLDYGKIRAAVNTPVGAKGKFLIRTKTTTMGVRGTEFIVASELKAINGQGANGSTGSSAASAQTVKTEITVVHGKVDVVDQSASKKSAPISLTAGKQLTTSAAISGDKIMRGLSSEGGGSKVVELSKSQLNTVVSEAKVEDKTFKQAVVIDSSSNNSSSNSPSNNPNGPGNGQGQGRGDSGGGMTIAAIRDSVAADVGGGNFAPPPGPPPGLPGTFQNGTNIPVLPRPDTRGGSVQVLVKFVK